MGPRLGRLPLVAIGVALMSCAPRPSHGTPDSAESLRAAPLEVEGDGQARLTLEVEAWRSWQPVRPTPSGEGDPLIAVVRLGSSAPIPAALGVETVHLLHGAEVWTAKPVEESAREAGSHALQVVVRNGPNWPAGDSIDVVAELRGTGSGTSKVAVRLRAPRTAIQRVD